MFFGQFGEDKYLSQFFDDTYKGVCVDVGAYDGVSGSNTYYFEKNGWECLCIEPVPQSFDVCNLYRKHTINCCVSNFDGENVNFSVVQIGNNNLSAISSLNLDQRLIESHKDLLQSITTISVKVKTLNTIFKETNFKKNIDFISIDTENTELDVLRGIDFDIYNINFLIIENNFNEPMIENYLITKNFTKIKRLAVNDFYVNNNYLHQPTCMGCEIVQAKYCINEDDEAENETNVVKLLAHRYCESNNNNIIVNNDIFTDVYPGVSKKLFITIQSEKKVIKFVFNENSLLDFGMIFTQLHISNAQPALCEPVQIAVSIGELVDKYSILEIKQRCIRDSKKLADVMTEKDSIAIAKKYIDAYPQFYHQLVYINQKIWDFTDKIKALEKNIDSNTAVFARISSNIFAFNQKRFRLKKYFNDLNNSTIKEQKSYAEDARFVENVRGKLDILAFLCTEYDSIYVSEPVNLPNPNLFLCNKDEERAFACIDLDMVDFDVPEIFRPIYYTASGLLGDFIIQLSVICENYYRTGRKGVLTMTDAVPFRRGLLKTYEDIRPIVIAQPYIQGFTLDYFPESSVDLGTWRENRLLHKVSWAELLLDEYGIQYGNHKWIHTENRPEWNSKVIIHTVSYRFPINLDFSTIVREHGIENVVFLGETPALLEKSTYDIFVERTGIQIPHVYVPETFAEMCIAINSCKLFVGALSMPLTIAQACKVPHIIGYSGIPDVDRMN